MPAKQEFSDREEIAPGLTRYDLAEASRKLRKRADGGNTPGFMLAFTTQEYPKTLGFNFYLHEWKFALALHAVGEEYGLFTFTGPFVHRGYHDSDDDEAADCFFRKSAEVMGVPYADLVKHIRDQRDHWRFECYVDGKPSDHPDNGRLWNPLFWYKIKDTIDQGRMPLYELPTNVRAKVIGALRAHVREGVVVLNR